MNIVEQSIHARQAAIIDRAKVPAVTATSLACWAEWMQGGTIGKGYPTKSMGFASGGVNCWDDFSEEAENHMAVACDGAIKSLSEKERNCIYIIWLGKLICYARLDVDEVAADAVKNIHRFLVIRGVT